MRSNSKTNASFDKSHTVYVCTFNKVFLLGRTVEPEHQGVAGMMAALFLICGIFCGVLFSLPMALIAESA
jgi:hypothetical protein